MTGRDGLALAVMLFGLLVPSISPEPPVSDEALRLDHFVMYQDVLELNIENVHKMLPEESSGKGVVVYKEGSGSGATTERRGRLVRYTSLWDKDVRASLEEHDWRVRDDDDLVEGQSKTKKKYRMKYKKVGEPERMSGTRNDWVCKKDAANAFMRIRLKETINEIEETFLIKQKAFWFLSLPDVSDEDASLVVLVSLVMDYRDGVIVGAYKLDKIGGKMARRWRVYYLSIKSLRDLIVKKKGKKDIFVNPDLFVQKSTIIFPSVAPPPTVQPTHALSVNFLPQKYPGKTPPSSSLPPTQKQKRIRKWKQSTRSRKTTTSSSTKPPQILHPTNQYLPVSDIPYPTNQYNPTSQHIPTQTLHPAYHYLPSSYIPNPVDHYLRSSSIQPNPTFDHISPQILHANQYLPTSYIPNPTSQQTPPQTLHITETLHPNHYLLDSSIPSPPSQPTSLQTLHPIFPNPTLAATAMPEHASKDDANLYLDGPPRKFNNMPYSP